MKQDVKLTIRHFENGYTDHKMVTVKLPTEKNRTQYQLQMQNLRNKLNNMGEEYLKEWCTQNKKNIDNYYTLFEKQPVNVE